jgi:hypothetical protein
MRRNTLLILSVSVLAAGLVPVLAQEEAGKGGAPAAPAAAPKGGDGQGGKLPYVSFDAKTRQVRVEAETLAVDTPLEFFAVVFNGPEHESVVRSKVKPSDLHTALLAVGLEPGAPVTYVKSANKWLPPHGPPLQIHMEYEKDGKPVSVPANRWMRNVRTKQPMPNTTWIFAGSRVMNDGNYAADSTGYLVSVVNFDMTVIDIPELASKDNESLEWERNPDAVPAAGTKVTMVLQPAGPAGDDGGGDAPGEPAAAAAPATARGADGQPGGPNMRAADAGAASDVGNPGEGDDVAQGISDVKLDEALVERATKKWEDVVGPRGEALRKAAQAHYEVINALRREQQRLIDEADRVQRAIDRLERQYQDMTTPQPQFDGGAADDASGDESDAPDEQ